MLILLAEDDIGVQYFIWKLLRSKGFSVINTGDGETALMLFRQHGPIDLLLTDVDMPRMNGLDLYDNISAEQPGVRVLLISGGASAIDQAARSGLPFLQKPFVPSTLLDAIEELAGAITVE
jgi:CheY-like chemotaxis protein